MHSSGAGQGENSFGTSITWISDSWDGDFTSSHGIVVTRHLIPPLYKVIRKWMDEHCLESNNVYWRHSDRSSDGEFRIQHLEKCFGGIYVGSILACS